MPELTDLTLLEAAAALAHGEVSALELTQACMGRIDALEPDVHAFLAQTPALALEQAKAADNTRRKSRNHHGPSLSPIHGIPLAIKDVLCLEGVPTTCGSRILEGFRPPYTATSVERVMGNGGVILGKTNTDEFAMGSSTENSAFGPTHNPWDLDRVPGGSSGGSAAAVAAGMAFAALGTDTGGSVRQPASFCGVTGIKTSYGRVSRYGLIAYGSSLDTVGALARSAADLLPVYESIAGHDPLDSTSVLEPPSPISLDHIDLTGLRIGVPKEYFIEGLQDEVEQAVRAAVDELANQGMQVQPISLPHTDLALPVYYLIAPAEASANLARYDAVRFGPRLASDDLWDQYLETRGSLFGPEVKRRIMLGSYALSAGYYDAYYGQAQKVRTMIKGDFDEAFQSVDLIACPVAPSTAFKIGEHGDDPLSMYLEDVFTLPANLAGIPGIAFPVGFDGDHLPIGMQLLGPHLSEETLFRVCHAYQQLTDWHERKPGLLTRKVLK
jgi:aspartyl-tRNA(Asn)/glutamyl-tRNA(Gln) amidotransferase subunit A